MSHLHEEKSPYLLQHVDNPVDWYPWSEAAFERARQQNKLIFLSIGYSTCHWCHVMAHECFEDADVADLLNQHYVAVKVDREERPDIDQVYMDVCQRLTGSGGWPLTIFMTPDQHPFHAATYIPKYGRQGRPGLMNLLPWLAHKWQNEPAFLIQAADDVLSAIRSRHESADHEKSLTLDHHEVATRALQNIFDSRFGGFGKAPKFPRPHDLSFLLQRARYDDHATALQMVETSLHHMRCGGIYDQLGDGFHRYATDERWLLPHFEKMLYDQAGLIQAYLEAWSVTGQTTYAQTARDILDYLERDMMTADGVFCSAEDADSEGEEGTFYLWTRDQITMTLPAHGEAFCHTYNITAGGNYHDEATGQKTGKNILHLDPDTTDLDKVRQDFAADRRQLLATRSQRVRPHRDDKIITAWNGMAISALSRAGRLLGEERFVRQAATVAAFVLKEMSTTNNRLLRRFRDGEAAIPAFAEDYAGLTRGLLDLYEADYQPEHLSAAARLATTLADRFQDPASGQLFDTADDSEELLVRPVTTFDGAMPSAGSTALDVFARLFLLTGNMRWQRAAQKLMQSVAADVARYPAGFTAMLQASSWLLRSAREVVIVGNRSQTATRQMLAQVRARSWPQTVVLFKPLNDDGTLAALAPFTQTMTARDRCPTAYICEDFACQAPLTDLAALTNRLAVKPT
ncbi:MAG: thioredoxin domain-containing protein [Desulfuromonadales bacterium]